MLVHYAKWYNKIQKQPPEVFCKKRLFLEISQISQENTCARVSFLIKLQALACKSSKNCLSVFDHFVILALKGLGIW